MRLITITITSILLLLANFRATAQIKKDTLRVLFVGNSYTYFENLAQVVSAISDSTQTKLITKKSTIGGAHLCEHWHGKRGLKTKEIIKKGKFNIVLLQEYSLEAIEAPDSASKYMKLFSQFIRENGNNHKTY